MSTEKKVWFITGVSSGLGKQLAKEVLSQGQIVVGTFRKQEQVTAFNNESPGNSFGVLIDVANTQMIIDGVKTIFDKFGKIDVVVNNAGYGIMGSVEEISDAEVRRQFEVNVFGVLTTIREVLPQMRKQRSGHIINITSIAGRVGSQGLGIYNGSKFALEGIGEALAAELKPLNIKVTNVEPGPFRTEWAGSSAAYDNTKIEDYESTVGERIRGLQNLSGNQPGNPVKAADAIYKLAQLEEAPVHLPLGKIAYEVFGNVNNGLIEELAKFEHLGKECDFE
ncbi:short-chain dehydrogenase/reductase [Tenacibaculum todarodis]|uniref:Short-chain dehydrogenase/reductase n=1 Tax=Tenacibaculum todarodis TaxID=1850252 RepID=A0A1L3JLB7_9FLAO|nr:oxidoreductase [Tenacibaculum todarodis]APG65889.1 short-chain dehydrogenase/reductase [Tenacibaculum todarodis]